MATRPTDPAAEWATDPAYDAPGKAWDTKTPRLEPSAGLLGEGWEPGKRPNVRIFNWLLGNHGDWLAFLSDEEVTFKKVFTADQIALGTQSDGTADWAVESSGAFGAAPRCRPLTDHAYASIIVKPPLGATITTIEIIVKAHANRGVSTDRWNVRAFERLWDWNPSGGISAPTLTELGSIQDDGAGTGLKLISFTGLTTDANDDADYPIWVQGPNSVGADDHLLACRATATAPRVA